MRNNYLKHCYNIYSKYIFHSIYKLTLNIFTNEMNKYLEGLSTLLTQTISTHVLNLLFSRSVIFIEQYPRKYFEYISNNCLHVLLDTRNRNNSYLYRDHFKLVRIQKKNR